MCVTSFCHSVCHPLSVTLSVTSLWQTHFILTSLSPLCSLLKNIVSFVGLFCKRVLYPLHLSVTSLLRPTSSVCLLFVKTHFICLSPPCDRNDPLHLVHLCVTALCHSVLHFVILQYNSKGDFDFTIQRETLALKITRGVTLSCVSCVMAHIRGRHATITHINTSWHTRWR